MDLVKVKSANLRAVGWAGGELLVEFVRGGRYRYLDVPEEVYAALMNAKSVGRFFRQRVRSRFKYEKVLAVE